jgi:hypothetical protein
LVARYLVMNQVWGTLCRLPMGRGAHTPNNTPGPSDLQIGGWDGDLDEIKF